MYFQRGPFPQQIKRTYIEQAKSENVRQFRVPIPIRRLPSPAIINLPATPAQRLIQTELKKAFESSVFGKGGQINLDCKRCNSAGVYVFDVLVFEKENSSEYPPVKLQVTDDYPGEIPMFLDLHEKAASISNKRLKPKFELAVQLCKKYLLALSESQYRIPDLIKLWSLALMTAVRFKPKPVKKLMV